MTQLGFAQCTILGRLTRDPGHRKEGQDPVNVGVAVNHTKGTDERPGKVSFFEIELWGDQAGVFRQYAKKGDQVLFIAEPYESKWVGKNDEKRSAIRFRVLRWQFTGSGSGEKSDRQSETLQEARERRAAESAPPADAGPDRPDPADDGGLSADDLMSRI